jgi:hypothetical protein
MEDKDITEQPAASEVTTGGGYPDLDTVADGTAAEG